MTDEVKPKPEDKKTEENVDALVAPEEIVDLDPILEPENVPDPQPKKINPISPGGMRFEQVYAKGKQAERELASTRERLAAAEAKLEVLTNTGNPPAGDVEYTPAQLDDFVKQGSITQADATAHLLEVNSKKTEQRIVSRINNETKKATRAQALQHGIQQYVEAVPAILVEGSEDRVRADEEFDFLASVEGLDITKIDDLTRKRLQLVALRNVYGSVDSLRKVADSVVKPVTHQGLPGGNRPSTTKNPDQALLDGLTKAEVTHYNKMFRSGRYPGGWKDVVEELKFKAPVKVRR